LFGPAYQTAWGWIGLIPLATGLVSWCPAYALLGIRTCKPAIVRWSLQAENRNCRDHV